MKLEARSVPVYLQDPGVSTSKIIERMESRIPAGIKKTQVFKNVERLVLSAGEPKETWTPYKISERLDGQVHISAGIPTFTTQVKDFTQKEFLLPVYGEKDPVLVTKIASDQYDVEGIGLLLIFDDACTYISGNNKHVFTAAIHSMQKRNAVCTGLAIVGASMRNAG